MIGKRIQELRNKLGLSQIGLCSTAGISNITLSRIENGHYKPSGETLAKLAAALKTNQSYLVGETDDPTPLQTKSTKNIKQAPPEPQQTSAQDIDEIIKRVSIQIKDEVPIPVFCGVRAGTEGKPLYEDYEGSVLVEKRWKDCIAIRVQGTSMVEAHILPGDLIIVCSRMEPQNGDTVVAYNEDHEFIVKKFWRIKGEIKLGATKIDSFPLGQLHVLGKVVEIRRKV